MNMLSGNMINRILQHVEEMILLATRALFDQLSLRDNCLNSNYENNDSLACEI